MLVKEKFSHQAALARAHTCQIKAKVSQIFKFH